MRLKLLKSIGCFIPCLVGLFVSSSVLEAAPGYFRDPAISGDHVVFIAEGDLWRVPVSGGAAVRLSTHHSGEEKPSFSPDGKWLAFVGRFEGPSEVYVMPAQGGLPRRITFDAAKISHVGWTPDGKVLVGTNVYSGLPSQQLVALDISNPDGGIVRTRIPLAQAADGIYSADGQMLFFTRLSFQGSHTRRYKGGTAQQLWSFIQDGSEARPLTSDYAGTSKSPMFWKDRVYFVSDRDGTMNLWSMQTDGKDPQQLTRHDDYDVASPALSEGRIVYQNGADLRIFEIASAADKLIPITLESDFDHTREKWIKNPIDFLTDAHPSPDGSKIAVTARGRVFVIPKKGGRLVEAGRTQGVRYRDARFMPDRKTLLLLSDESGEVELWTTSTDGTGPATKLTTDGTVLRRKAVPSPNGKYIAHADKNFRLHVLNVQTKESKLIAESPVEEFEEFVWSPDSKWLAYAEQVENLFRQIKLYSLADGKMTAVTTDRYDSFSPSFSPDGKWLYFLSDRHLKSVVESPWGTYQPEPFLDKKTKIYQLPLVSGTRSPFSPTTEVDGQRKEENKEEKKDEKKELAAPALTIDLDLIASRLIPVPVPPGNYRSLGVTDKALFWLSIPAGERRGSVEGILIGNDDPETKTIADNVAGFEISADGKKLLIVREKELLLADALVDRADPKKSHVDTSGWTFSVNPREEWEQIFDEAWRLERDYFYDLRMHGVDWKGVRDKYRPLLPRVTDRSELDDLIAQMVSELSALHIFVRPGDERKGTDDITPGRLGAILVRSSKQGGYQVDHIYQNDPDEPERAAPLARPDVNIKEGDIIVSIDGARTLAVAELSELLRRKVGRQVLLEVKPANGEVRKVVVKPISPTQEDDLRYHEWEYTRRTETDKLGEGQIGYLHLRAMGGDDFSAWARGYYPAFTRGGLIIDVRNNRGGNIDSWIVGRLLRKAWFYWNQRVGRANSWNMQYAFRGHVVVLCNEWTASDGEAFSEAAKRLKLGTVIGTRTWGGEIWLSSSNRLVDKGIATSAEFGVFDQAGDWLIEGHGVDPDLVVDNLPHATFNGQDAQLLAAVNFLKQKLKESPVTLPPVPDLPTKTGVAPKADRQVGGSLR